MTEITVTKEMLDAGHEMYRDRWNRHHGPVSMKVVIEEIYLAMRALEPADVPRGARDDREQEGSQR